MADFPCAGCGNLLRFKTQDQLDEHTRGVHPPELVGVDATSFVLKEEPVATKPQKADPQNCQICARLGEKCKRHGGVAHSTSYQGKGVKVSPKTLAKQNQRHKDRRDKKRGLTRAVFARSDIDGVIAQLEAKVAEITAELDVLRRAKAIARNTVKLARMVS